MSLVDRRCLGLASIVRTAIALSILGVTPFIARADDFEVLSAVPARASVGETISVAIHGQGFVAGSVARLTLAGDADAVAIQNTVSPDGGTLEATFDLTGRALGFRDVVVTRPDLVRAIRTQGFEILPAEAYLTHVEPGFGQRNHAMVLTIHGGRLLPDPHASLTLTGGVVLNSSSTTLLEDGRSILAGFTVPLSATSGPVDVRVWWDTPQGTVEATLPGGFNIRDALPTLGNIIPNVGPNSGSVGVLITGSWLDDGADLRLRRAGNSDIRAQSVIVYGGTISAWFDLRDRAPGVWDVVVINPDGSSATLAGGFRIVSLPHPEAVSPTRGGDGAIVTLTVTGRGFDDRTRARLEGPGWTAVSEPPSVTADGRTLTATFDLRSRTPGHWQLVISSDYSDFYAPVPSGFDIVPGPLVDAVTPDRGPDRGSTTLTVSGSRLAGGSITLVRGGTIITASSVTVGSPGGTTISATFDLLDRAPGAYEVIVTNEAGIWGTLPQAFEILRAPRIATIAPAHGGNGAVVNVVVGGAGFLSGLDMRLVRAGSPDVVGGPVQVAGDGSSCSAAFDLIGRAPGAYDLVVTNSNGVADTRASGFEIESGTGIAFVSPAAGEQGAAVIATVAGHGFTGGSTVRLLRGADTVTGGSLHVSAAGDSITASFDLAGHSTGRWDVVVAGNAGTEAWLPQGFEVQALELSPSGVVPTGAGNGGPAIVVVTGQLLRSGASARLTRAGQSDAVGSDVAVAQGGTLLSATFDLTGLALGRWDLIVANSAGSADTLPGAFEVRPGPLVHPSGLDLTWNACRDAPSPGADDVTLDCSRDTVVSLFGAMRVPSDLEGFIAADVVMDLAFPDGDVPPFWHLDDAGCHAGGLTISAASPEEQCPSSSAQNPWGKGGNDATALITAFAPGFGQPNHARLLMTLARAAFNPTDLVGGESYHAFRLDLRTDHAGACVGCDVAVEWSWVSATLYSAGGGAPVVVMNPGLRYKTVTVNGGDLGPTVSSVWPARVPARTGVPVSIYGHRFWPGANVRIAGPDGSVVPAREASVSQDGQVISAVFDLAGRMTGEWDVVVTNPDQSAAELKKALTVDRSTPTLLLSFEATPLEDAVELHGQLADPTDYARCWLERADRESGPWSRAGGEPSLSGNLATWTDAGLVPGATYHYRLQLGGGEIVTLGRLSVTVGAARGPLGLRAVRPNPSAGAVRVPFALARRADVRISVVDLQGRELTVLTQGERAAGSHEVIWNGAAGANSVTPGLYFVRAAIAGKISYQRVAIVR
jgi:hypothetical protein